jgi:lipoate-protein ligase A
MEADDVPLVRRKSGGGAVYQDLGNSIFSFMQRASFSYDYKGENNQTLLHALELCGINAESTGRNDLTFEGKKISGSAFKLDTFKGRTSSLHHGTLLIDIDLNGVTKYLNPNKAKLQSKGINSVASRVMNLSE